VDDSFRYVTLVRVIWQKFRYSFYMNILDCMLKTITTVRLQRLWSVG